ncbi:MAG: hypothetical protein CME59_15100 [Halioglobus sp.]|nr:hypothetical protein [Halioglobus sp.]|tara:strand:- start:211 stop:1233 length:1023 start_codon:yes stop_codon:yes gene_type:complete
MGEAGERALILHMGRHKTGTSTLQRYLLQQRAHLRDHGVEASAVGAKKDGRANNLLARACNDEMAAGHAQRREEYRADLAAEFAALAPGQRLLVTSEGFQNANPAHVARLFPRPLQLVVYLREQFSYLLSSYCQIVHNQAVSLDVADYAARHFDADYTAFLDAWAAALPDASWTVRVYDRERLLGGDICRDFMHAIGLPFAAADTTGRDADQNPSIGGAILEFKRRLNSTPFGDIIAPKVLYLLLQEVARAHPELNRGVHFPAELAQQLRARYRASNAALARRWFAPGQALFEYREVAPVDPQMLTAPALQQVAAALDGQREGLGSALAGLMRERGAWPD